MTLHLEGFHSHGAPQTMDGLNGKIPSLFPWMTGGSPMTKRTPPQGGALVKTIAKLVDSNNSGDAQDQCNSSGAREQNLLERRENAAFSSKNREQNNWDLFLYYTFSII